MSTREPDNADDTDGVPRVIVFSSLFPSAEAPTAGGFIRDRMFRVAKRMPLVVVSPRAWSPFDWLVRLFRPTFRPPSASFEVMEGVEVHRPRALSIPGVFKRYDGVLMAWSTRRFVERLNVRFGATVLDAHFAYPDGFAAVRIGRRLGVPVVVSLRGSKDQRLLGTSREAGLREAVQGAARLIAVSRSLVFDVGRPCGIEPERIDVVSNGVDLSMFSVVDRQEARRRLDIDVAAKVILGVGNLIPLKGFQRVIPLLPDLRKRFPDLVYLIVGGASSQGDMSDELLALARHHGVEDCVRLCGRQPPSELKWFYGAADVFALASEYEGLANVLLEAMACGVPVVATRVGGNPEVVRTARVGTLVDFWDAEGFAGALSDTLGREWDRLDIARDAERHGWEARIDALESILRSVSRRPSGAGRSRDSRRGSSGS